MLHASGSLNNTAHTSEDLFISQLIQQARYVEAYSLLIRERQESVTTLFNMALCHFMVGDYSLAVSFLDKTSQFLPRPSMLGNAQHSPQQRSLTQWQSQGSSYLQPISQKYIQFFADAVSDNILRLKIDCLLELGDFQKLISTASPIEHKGFKNVNDALARARKKQSL